MFTHSLTLSNKKLSLKKKYTFTFKPSNPSNNVKNTKQHMPNAIHCNIIYNSKVTETTQISIKREVDEKTMVHTHRVL